MNYFELAKRVAVAVIGIPLIFFLTYQGKIFFVALISVIQVGALWELYSICEHKGFYPLKTVGIVSVLALTLSAYFFSPVIVCALIPFIYILISLIELFRGKTGPIANIATTFFGFLYMGLLTSLVMIREIPKLNGGTYKDGGILIIFLLIGIWICDTVAYFWGSYLGKHALFKRVSPKKTWEGAIAGFIAALIATYGFGKIFFPAMNLRDILVIGTGLGVIGQVSDLLESLFKRDAKLKDSSNILPGHGGMLDRFDSPILIGPLIYLYFILFGFPV